MEKSKKMKKIKLISVISFIILFIICTYLSYRSDYLQILEIGEEYLSTFEERNEYKIKLFAFNFVFISLVILINNILIKRGLKVFFDDDKKEMPKLPNKSIAFILSSIISVIATTIMLEKVVLYLNQAWFGITDPVFGLDIGFYFFQKPFIELILYYIVSILIALTIYTVAYYIIVFNIYLDGVDREVLIKSTFVKRLKMNALLIIIGIAGIVFLSTYDIVFNEFIALKNTLSTKIIGAGLSDITIKLWGYRILTVLMVVSTILILKYVGKGKIKKLLTSICIVPVYLVSIFVILVLFNLIFINNNKLDKEKQYIGYNIDYTKQAYNLNIDETEYANSESITKNDLEENVSIINNIRVVDEDTTLKNLNSLQTNSGYYSYRTTNLQLYSLNGQDTLVYVSPREINTTETSTYNNKTYEYTHGFGSVISYANKVDTSGNVEYIQKDFISNNDKIKIEEPRIYFGMQTDSAIITNLFNKSEFDYPVSSTVSTEYQYKGEAGIKVNFLDRLILSITNKDINLTFSDVSKDSKVLLNRNIIKRAKKILPELQYDENPYLIITDEGKQIWVIDAYTTSNEYPYSQRTEIEGFNKQINYIRNSVKVLIDSYNGTIDFYIMDKTDPIILAYQNIYPNLFKDGETIPNSISSHFVYPNYLYNVQAEVLKMYHNVSEDILYRGNDIWEYATYSANSKTTVSTEVVPYYTMVEVNNENKIGLIIPYTVDGRQNITSYLIGTDLNGNLNLKLYKYAAGSNVIGPEQLDREIEQDETISAQIKSINVTGTKITKKLIIVPINNSLLYVESIYQQQLNEKNSIPLLKKIIVASGNKVAIGNNLKEALENLVSQSAVNIKVENTDTLDDIIDTIIEANNNLKESTESKDFEMIGKDITKLQYLIDELEVQNIENEKQDKESKKSILGNVVE